MNDVKKIIITCIILVFQNYLNAQDFCHTPQTTSNYQTYSSILKSSVVLTNYTLRIYIHVIRRSNGTGGQSKNSVNQAITNLDMDFNPHGIFFHWDGTINYINSDAYYSNATEDIFSVNNHDDGIDIYLFDDSVDGGGLANGVGESSEYFVAGSKSGPPYVSYATSHIVSHEMGHVLFLWHTHHGTYDEHGSDGDQCAELVNGSNSSICGDYLTDTPADPKLSSDNVDPVSCTCTITKKDANEDTYSPDFHLIMSYSHPNCLSYFTQEQGQRMRNAIATLPHLISATVNCANEPVDIISNTIFNDNYTISSCEIEINEVTIQNNSKIILNVDNNTTIQSNFEVKLGSQFEIK